jgi:hypothetical protein
MKIMILKSLTSKDTNLFNNDYFKIVILEEMGIHELILRK